MTKDRYNHRQRNLGRTREIQKPFCQSHTYNILDINYQTCCRDYGTIRAKGHSDCKYVMQSFNPTYLVMPTATVLIHRYWLHLSLFKHRNEKRITISADTLLIAYQNFNQQEIIQGQARYINS